MRTPTAILLTLTVLMVRAEATPPREAPGPVVLDQRVQLFIDDVLIERTERVWRTLTRWPDADPEDRARASGSLGHGET